MTHISCIFDHRHEYLYVLQDLLSQLVNALDMFLCWLDIIHSVANAFLEELEREGLLSILDGGGYIYYILGGSYRRRWILGLETLC